MIYEVRYRVLDRRFSTPDGRLECDPSRAEKMFDENKSVDFQFSIHAHLARDCDLLLRQRLRHRLPEWAAGESSEVLSSPARIW